MSTFFTSPSRPVVTTAERSGRGEGAGVVASGSTGVRVLFVALLVAALVGGFVATSTAASAQAVSAAGEDLTRLLRGMAALKVLLALGAMLGVLWRLGAPVSAPRFVVYAVACGAMALGPGLVWEMVYVRAGAVLLHGGLLVAVVVLWRDEAAGTRLAEKIAERRRRLGGAPGRPVASTTPPG